MAHAVWCRGCSLPPSPLLTAPLETGHKQRDPTSSPPHLLTSSPAKSKGKAPTEQGTGTCSSGLSGDTNEVGCAAFCKADKASNHCRFCKCRTCGFCASLLSASRAAAPGSTAPGSAALHLPCKSKETGDFSYKTCAPFCQAGKAGAHCLYCKCADCHYCAAAAAHKVPTVARLSLEAGGPPLVAAFGVHASASRPSAQARSEVAVVSPSAARGRGGSTAAAARAELSAPLRPAKQSTTPSTTPSTSAKTPPPPPQNAAAAPPGVMGRIALLLGIACLPTLLLLAWHGLAPAQLSPQAMRLKLREQMARSPGTTTADRLFAKVDSRADLVVETLSPGLGSGTHAQPGSSPHTDAAPALPRT